MAHGELSEDHWLGIRKQRRKVCCRVFNLCSFRSHLLPSGSPSSLLPIFLLQDHRPSSIPIFRYRFLSANQKPPQVQVVSPSPINDSQRFTNSNKISQRVTPILIPGLDTASSLGAVGAGGRTTGHTYGQVRRSNKKFIFPGFTNTRDSRLYSPGRGKRPGLNISATSRHPDDSSTGKESPRSFKPETFHSRPLHAETHPCWFSLQTLIQPSAHSFISTPSSTDIYTREFLVSTLVILYSTPIFNI